MGRHLAVGANSFARKWFVPVDRANEFAPTRSLLLIENRAAYGERIVHALRAQLSWTHFKSVIYIDDPLKRDFYAEMCRAEYLTALPPREVLARKLHEAVASARARLAQRQDDEELGT